LLASLTDKQHVTEFSSQLITQLLSTCSNSLLSVLGLSTLHVSIIVEYDSLTLMAEEEELQTQAYYKINQCNMQK